MFNPIFSIVDPDPVGSEIFGLEIDPEFNHKSLSSLGIFHFKLAKSVVELLHLYPVLT